MLNPVWFSSKGLEKRTLWEERSGKLVEVITEGQGESPPKQSSMLILPEAEGGGGSEGVCMAGMKTRAAGQGSDWTGSEGLAAATGSLWEGSGWGITHQVCDPQGRGRAGVRQRLGAERR